MIRFVSLILSTTILASCAGTGNMKAGDHLAVSEGIVVTTCQTPNAISRYVNVFPESFKPKLGSMAPMIKCTQGGTLHVLKLAAGNYHTGYTPNHKIFKHLPQFNVQANKINYIGDLRIAVRETNIASGLLAGFKQPKISFSAIDKQSDTMQRLNEQRPDIAGKYAVVSDIARKK